jgi:biopolymer transport protein ExbB
MRKGYQELVSLEDINTAIENAGKLEIYKLEKNVSMLATISGAGL